MRTKPISRIFAVLAFVHGGAVAAATIDVLGVIFNPDNGIAEASIVSGGYATVHGRGLFSGGSGDRLAPDAAGRSLGKYFQKPTFQPGYDAATPGLGNPEASVTPGAYPPDLTNARDIISVKWPTGIRAVNGVGNDVAVFEKGTSEAYAVRAHNATTDTWGPWYYENQ